MPSTEVDRNIAPAGASGADAEVLAATEANSRFGELLQRAHRGGERFVITRHGAPAAAIVPIGDLDALKRAG